MTDAKTLAFYDAAARDYAEQLSQGGVRPELAGFIARVRPGGRVLDLGCGPGKSSAEMALAGLVPDPVDASTGMVAFARDTHGLPARHGTFDDDWGVESYDGIWASYSLLHAPRAEIPGHIARLAAALRPGGPFYLGMKLGETDERDRLDRFYSHVTEAELRGWVTDAGLTVADVLLSESRGMAGTLDPCIDLTAVKPADA